MNINQYNLTKYNPMKHGSKTNGRTTVAGDDTNHVDTARQFGDRIDLIFPDLWKEQRTPCLRDLVEKVGVDVTCALLGDAIGAKVLYDEDKGVFSWGKSKGIRYQPDNVRYEADDDYPLSYDESGHLVSPLRWHNSAALALVCGLDLTHGYRSDFAFVDASLLYDRDLERGVNIVKMANVPPKAHHLLIRSFWGGPHSATRGMPFDQKKGLWDANQLTFYCDPHSNGGGEGVDYFCVSINPGTDGSERIRAVMRDAFLIDAQTQLRASEEFWKRNLNITALYNRCTLLEMLYEEERAKIKEQLKLCEKSYSCRKDSLLHLPDANGMPKLEALPGTEELYACPAEELEEMVEGLEKLQDKLLAYTAKFKIITKNWLDYAQKFLELNDYLLDGWVEIFGDAAVMTFPSQRSVVTAASQVTKLGAMNYQQTVFPLSAGALSEAAILVHEHQEEVETNQRAARMSVTAMKNLCKKEND